MKKMFEYISCLVFVFMAIGVHAQQIQEDKYTYYNSLGFVSQENKPLSNGDIMIKYYSYSGDWIPPNQCNNTSTDGAGVINLISKNILNAPIENYTVIQNSSGYYVTGAELYSYYSNQPYVKSIYKLEINTPILSSSFSTVGINISTCNYGMNSNYVLQENEDAYDNYGNILQKTLRNGKSISYIYSFKNASKICEVTNATNSQIAYTSFETTDQGFWSYLQSGVFTNSSTNAVAGSQSYSLISGDIIRSNLTYGNYIVTFFAGPQTVNVTATSFGAPAIVSLQQLGGFGIWNYYQATITGATDVDISGGTSIDELRLYPQNAEMETFNYIPLVGYDYTCDVSSHITHYEYDDLGRLTIVRDMDNNIIKKYEYGLQTTE